MLQAQVNYWQLMEQKRHNLAEEGLKSEGNAINRANLDELIRHQLATEGISSRTLDETIAQNRWDRRIDQGNLTNAINQTEIRSREANTAQQRADTAQLEANVKQQQYELDLRKLLEFTIPSLVVDQRNAAVNERRADVAEKEADIKDAAQMLDALRYALESRDTAARELDAQTRSRQVDVAEAAYELSKQENVRDWIKTILNASNSASDIAGTLVKAISLLGGI